MDVYSCLTEDTRYRVPTVTLLFADSESEARGLALELLGESACHLSVEVSIQDTVLFKVRRRNRTPPDQNARISS
jgi:hypothetical protein